MLYLEINPDAVFSSDNNLDHYSLFITQEESLPYAVYVYSVYSTAVLFIVEIFHFFHNFSLSKALLQTFSMNQEALQDTQLLI